MLVDKSSRVWAMRPDELVSSHVLQMRADHKENGPQAVMSGKVLEGSDFARVVNGVAIIPVKGPLMRSFSYWMWSYEEILRDLRLAQRDEDVSAIVLEIDSPGGLVSGCADMARAIRMSGPKPVEAFIGGLGASAAYWIASATDRITLGSGAVVGSLGSVIEYVDMEPMFEKMGARIIRVVAEQSPNKRLNPDSDQGRAEMQALVNASGADFVASVAEYRGVTEAEVLERFGQGLIFDGDEAIRRGMADRRGTLDDLIAELAGRNLYFNAVAAAAAQENPVMDWASLTLAALREHRADIVEEIEGAASAVAVDQAVEAERARIIGLDEIAVAGYEDMVEAAKRDGKTSPEQLALQIMKAEKAAGGNYLAAAAAADAAVTIPAAPLVTEATGGAGDTIEDRAKADWDKDADLRAEFGSNFDAYLAFAKAESAGLARVKRG